MTAPAAPSTALPASADACWRAAVARDASFDGKVIVGVTSTRIFCKPSCPARTPKRENVRFYACAAEALADGLRPCKRCKPLDNDLGGLGAPAAETARAVCRYIEAHIADDISLPALAKRFDMSVSTLQRTFKAAVGLTPKAFADACRLRALKGALRDGASVTEAIFEAGYSGAARGYAHAARGLAMTPRAFQAGGAGEAIAYAFTPTRFGLVMIAATARGVCFVALGEDQAALAAELAAQFPAARLAAPPPADASQFQAWNAAIRAHMEDAAPHPDLPLDVAGTAFQWSVWRFLQTIPRGETRSYAEVAQAVGKPKASRAAARACATNPVPILIPCHRVIRGDGSLSGYRWGADRKAALLAAEKKG